MSRTRSVLAVLTVLVLAVATTAAALAAGSKGKAKKDSGTVYFAIAHSAGGYQYATGYSSDRLLGLTTVYYKIKLLPSGTTGVIKVNVKGLTLFTKDGSLVGTGSADENVTTGAVTNGHFNLTKGTGGQKGHSFVGTFSGKGSVSTNTFSYTYHATYK